MPETAKHPDVTATTSPTAAPGSTPGSGALAGIAAALAAATSLEILTPGPGRRYALVRRTAEHEAWLIAWPHGTGLGLHDHGGAEAAIVMMRGRLRERYQVADDLTLRWLTTGDLVSLPGDHRHELVNVDPEEAVSLHVYAPCLGERGNYGPEREIVAWDRS